MKAAKLIAYFLSCGVLAWALYVFYHPPKESPNSEKALRAASRFLGAKPPDVTDLFHEYDGGFHGDDGHEFRFRYVSSEWIDGFISSVAATQGGGGANCNIHSRNPRWPAVEGPANFEHYVISVPGNYYSQQMSVDRARRLVFVSLSDS